MHGHVQQSATTSRMFAEIAMAETLAAVCDVFVRRIEASIPPLRIGAPKEKKATRTAREKKIKRLEDAIDRVINAADTLAHFRQFLVPLLADDYREDVASTVLNRTAREVAPLLERLKTMERLTLSYPTEVIGRCTKIRNAAMVL